SLRLPANCSPSQTPSSGTKQPSDEPPDKHSCQPSGVCRLERLFRATHVTLLDPRNSLPSPEDEGERELIFNTAPRPVPCRHRRS
ncbi:hypothetical protein CN168_20850, partial [Sinorhizobium medicae]